MKATRTTAPSIGASDFLRGMADGRKFDYVRRDGDGFLAGLRTGSEAWLVQPVTVAYCDGLRAVGCDAPDVPSSIARAA